MSEYTNKVMELAEDLAVKSMKDGVLIGTKAERLRIAQAIIEKASGGEFAEIRWSELNDILFPKDAASPNETSNQ